MYWQDAGMNSWVVLGRVAVSNVSQSRMARARAMTIGLSSNVIGNQNALTQCNPNRERSLSRMRMLLGRKNGGALLYIMHVWCANDPSWGELQMQQFLGTACQTDKRLQKAFS